MSDKEMAEFILADNQELTRYGLENLLQREEERHTVYRATDKAGLIELLKAHENSIVLLDYTLFDFSDEASLLVVGERFAMARWVLISDELTEKFLRNVVYANRNVSVVFKDEPLKTIVEALHYAVRNDRYISQRATEMLLFQQQDEEEEEPKTLTATEIEILRGIAQGKTTKEIATERYSSIHTINTHRKNIFRKLGVNTAHEAVKYAFRAGMVDPSEFYI